MINEFKLYVVHYLLFDTANITDDLLSDPGEHLLGQYYTVWCGKDEEEALNDWREWNEKNFDGFGWYLDFIEEFKEKKGIYE